MPGPASGGGEAGRGDSGPVPEIGDERQALARLRNRLPAAPEGETWSGDDAAVVKLPGAGRAGPWLLLAADAVVAGVDADLSLTSLSDLGWKAMAVNLSDIAAMGGHPGHALVSVVGVGPAGLDELYEGICDAASSYGCPVVGGDLSGGTEVVVSVAVTGYLEGSPVLRRGAGPADIVWCTGQTGAAAAGLRMLRAAGRREGVPQALVQAHARPRPALAEGSAARLAGATAMIDVSDGLLADLGHLADASRVGYELDFVPVAPGARVDEALAGGDDYVLVFTAPPAAPVEQLFADNGLRRPMALGRCTADPGRRLLRGEPTRTAGWSHRLGGGSAPG